MTVRLRHRPLTSASPSRPDHSSGTCDSDQSAEVAKILDRARRAGINPLRVIIALGLDCPQD